MQVSDIVKVIAPDMFERLIYVAMWCRPRTRDAKKVITAHLTFQATGDGAAAAETVAPRPIPACPRSSARSCRVERPD
jgi:electron transfer flavoprotein alpha subunit